MEQDGQDAPRAQSERPPRHRPLVPVLVGLASGIALDARLQPPGWAWLAVLAPVAALAWWGVRGGLGGPGCWVLAVVLTAAFGGFWHEARFRHRGPEHLTERQLDGAALYCVRGRVRDAPLRHVGRTGTGAAPYWSTRVALEGLSADGRVWRRASGGVTVFSDGERPPVRAGDRVEFRTSLQGNRPPTNPGERDRALVYDRQGSHATASVHGPEAFRVLQAGRLHRPAVAAGRARAFLDERLAALLAERSPEAYGLIGALLLGRRNELTAEQDALLKESGTLHFLAISGLHVGLFCLFWQSVLALTGLRVGWRSSVCIVLIWGYVLLTGAQVSATRAALMLTLMLAAPLVGRQWDSLSALCAAAVVILVVWPPQLFSVGFQLTFVAVWALICVYPRLSGLLWPWQDLVDDLQHPAERSVWGDLWRVSKAYLLLSCVVWAVTAPLRVYHFHMLSVWGPLVNLLMWPLVLAVLISCLPLAAGMLLGGPAAGLTAAVAAFFADAAHGLLRAVVRLPGAAACLAGPPAWWVALCYAAMALWVLGGRQRRGRTVFIIATALLGMTYVGNDVAVRLGRHFRLTIADVGMGQAALMEVPAGQTLLLDAGSRRWSARTAVAELLWHRRVRRLDAVVLSHLDSDHCSFVPFLAERFAIRRIMVPEDALPDPPADRVRETLRDLGFEWRPLRQGAHISGGGLCCRVLHPSLVFATTPGLSDNDGSLVVRCDYGGARILLTGDVQERAMHRLVSDCAPELRADVLLMPHHAHFHPGLEAFVAAVRPRVAVVSGRPADCDPRAAAHLAERGTSLWITGREGAIIVRVQGGRVSVRGHASGRTESFAPAEPSSPP